MSPGLIHIPGKRSSGLRPGFAAYATLRHLGGVGVSRQQILDEIAKWPLDAFLDFLGSISLEMFQLGRQFLDPRHQGGYLNLAIVDDFPAPLARVAEMYLVGRVPLTGGLHILAHEHNLAWLVHAALMHADTRTRAPEISYPFKRRVCRLLLAASDMLPSGPLPRQITDETSLRDRRGFVMDWLIWIDLSTFGNQVAAHPERSS